MFTASNCEPTLPKSVHLKREASSIAQQSKHIDTTTLINNTSTSTINSPTIRTSPSVSSNFKTGKKNNNAMTPKAQETVINIKQRAPVKSIRIERDYSLADGITRFQTEYPVELEGKVTIEQFNHTITIINKAMDYADRISWPIVLENIMEILTIYISPIFLSTHYQRAVKKLLAFIESENDHVYYQHSLSISDPVKAAFLFIEINFYD